MDQVKIEKFYRRTGTHLSERNASKVRLLEKI